MLVTGEDAASTDLPGRANDLAEQVVVVLVLVVVVLVLVVVVRMASSVLTARLP